MRKYYDSQATSGGGGEQPEEQGIPEATLQLCKDIAQQVCPHEVYGPTEKEWNKCSLHMEFIEGAINGALGMYRHLSQKKEPVLPRWVKVSDELPLHKAHWITGKYGTHDNDFPVRMNGRYAMANIFYQRLQRETEPKYMLQFEGMVHYENEFTEIEWLEESLPADTTNNNTK